MNSSGVDAVNHTDFTPARDSPSLPLWSRITYMCIVSIISVLSITGNGLILTVQYYTKNKTSTDWLVSFMAAIDVASSVFEIARAILYVSGVVEDIDADALCGVITFLRNYTQYTSCLLLTTISIERYFKTCRPHSTVFTPKKTIYICIGITLGSSLVNVPFIPTSEYKADSSICKMNTSYGAAETFASVFRASFIAMIAALIVMYTKVAFAMRKRVNRVRVMHVGASNSTQTGNTLEMKDDTKRSDEKVGNRSTRCHSIAQRVSDPNTQERNLLKLTNRISFCMCSLTTVFIITLFPISVFGVLVANRPFKSSKENFVLLLMRTLPSVNSVTNPIFFVLMSSKFRKQSKVVLFKKYRAIKTMCCR